MTVSVHHGRRLPRSAAQRRVALVALLASAACYSESFAQSEGSASMSASTTIDPTTGDVGTEGTGTGTGSPATSSTDDGETSAHLSETAATASSEDGGDSSDDGSSTAADDTTGDTGTTGESSTTGAPILVLDDLAPGDLVITEVMWNPDCMGDSCEWIEVLNATASPVNLLDLFVRDIDNSVGNQGRVTTDLIVEAGALVLLTRGVGNWPYTIDADAVYGPNPGLNNNEPDSVSISRGMEILDETPTLPFDAPSGTAWSLSGSALDAVSNDNALNWCLATTVLPTGLGHEFGTPREINPACGG